MALSKLKIAGAWSGTLELDLANTTVPALRAEIARRADCNPTSINLIFAGRVLKDDDNDSKPSLVEVGLKNNAKILASKVNVDQGKSLQQELLADEQRSSRFARLKAAVAALATRHADGLLPVEDYNIELETQTGQKYQMGSETDQRSIMMGLMLHTKGKQLMREQQFKDALEVLEMGEEAFSLCDPTVIELVDNVPMLQIDMVWCYFMLRDINLLSVAGERLAKARKGIERAHGKDMSRVRLLQKGRSTELALYLRLELLEGVAAFHCGKLEKSREAFASAKAKLSKLKVSDETLSLLMGMGYLEAEATRALKLNEQNVQSAVNFLVEEREMKAKKHADNLKRQEEIREQKKYGKTPLGKAVDLQRLNELVSIGFEKELAAEALRRHENDAQNALDNLTNPEENSKLQTDIESRKRKRRERNVQTSIEQLVSMGFDRSRVTAAMNNAHGSMTEALNELIAQGGQGTTIPVNGPVDSTPNLAPGFHPAGSSSSQDGESPSSSNSAETADESGSPSTSRGPRERDVDMEKELINDGDIYGDYDLDVTIEGEALNEYLALLDSALDSRKPSSQ